MRENPTQIERKMLRWLGMLFDLVVMALGTITMLYVVWMIYKLAVMSLQHFSPEEALHGIVLILIFLEMFEIITLYVIYHHVPMKNVVEIGVLVIVKELIVAIDLTTLGWQMLLGMAVLIAVMGWVYTRERMREDAHKQFLLEHGIKDTEGRLRGKD
ncbi:phosphate-starvation-inducible PsiE family protein [Thermococcus sp. MAR1]|uniref:phosphate-starvation-inducible PsiE family protein n=1 Tax=Thermococcus sp. MAR1 TaxID=1638263 RepID=UPI001438D577|nr:phosphate-starvation-inducible PsiE family protein [Thermococcus sp. MAR1]NJE10778.1 hypothetical protein [Thermococcus sp. MAR1]